ncbi:hypothetical protein ADM98_00790 [Exiguobacterium sp. BMC-KP]|uniref:hypothetical protein n=1 Tax=Exiguobacterium sp. BMC-KP TaxID=1684312 RepID=UPI0006AA5123|nr:hypothetical protein [Exiguobacterium sp. BMC-KP]KOP31417.1 hypothetical protein ADM98_00790 [Exiguobacterium sp. BMC-KP]
MIYLRSDDARPATMHDERSTFTLLMEPINTLLNNHSFISIPGQTDILLFMALRERISLTLHHLDSSEVHSSSVYIEGIDYLQNKLTIRDTDSSLSNEYSYVHENPSYQDSSVVPLIS